MKSDIVKLGDVVDILTGFPFRSASYSETKSGLRLVRGDNIVQGGFRWDGVKYWSHDHDQRYVLREGDVVVAMDRPWIDAGLKCACIGRRDAGALLVQRVARLRANPSIDPGFLYTIVRSESFTNHVLGIQTGTAVPHISKAQISAFRFELPEKGVQRAIGDLAACLSSRIDMLRANSESLEAIAGAMFKAWFVDFNPVKAKSEGREPEGMNATIAAMFPSTFTDEGLPLGFSPMALGQVADVIDCLHSKKPLRSEVGSPLLQLWNIRNDGLLDMSDTYYIEQGDYAAWIARMEATEGDCVITNVGRVGAVAQVPSGVKAALGRNMTGIRPKTSFPFPTFLVTCLLSDVMKAEMTARTDTGTILNALNVRSIPKLAFVQPTRPLLEAFEQTCRPLRARMELNLAEARTLALVRDTLIPRLISGKIRIPEAEELIVSAL